MANELGRLLVKRSHRSIDGANLSPFSKRQHTASDKQVTDNGMEACVELCSLLLQKAGADTANVHNTIELQGLLSDEYSPRAVELISAIAAALDKDHAAENASDVTESSDEDDCDAVVPVLSPKEHAVSPTNSKNSEHVVPELRQELHTPGSCASTDAKLPAMSKNLESSPNVVAYRQETEIAISRIFDLGKKARVENPGVSANAPYSGPSVVTMTGFGELGRFGNQILQYMFLKCYASAHGVAEIQVPGWVGAGLFGLNDRPVQRYFPAAVEFRGTVANSTFTTDFIDYVKRSSPDGVAELTPASLRSRRLADDSERVENVDVWGWFQWHTSHFKRFKNLIVGTFSPVPVLQDHCEHIFNRKLRNFGGVKRTVVGLHLRLGDYQNIAASSFGYCAPTLWYLEWLAKIWPTLHNPILFVASDDLGTVLRDFADYSPFTADSIGLTVPKEMDNLKAGFFPDWFCLTQCDVLAISNSTFSFTACLMNQRPSARFFRAHYKDRMVAIDPWNCDPIVHRDMKKAGLSAALDTLQIVYNTQGSKGLARNIFYELPYYGVRAAVMKAVLWKQSRAQAVA